MNWCVLIPLLVGVICALLGYLLGKNAEAGKKPSFNVYAYKNRIAKLEADLETCKSSKASG